MGAAGLDIDANLIIKADVHSKLIVNSGHQIGECTALLMNFAGKYLSPMRGQKGRLYKPMILSAAPALPIP